MYAMTSALLLKAKSFLVKRELERVRSFAVAVMRGDTVIGHIPKKISSICSLFLCKEDNHLSGI